MQHHLVGYSGKIERLKKRSDFLSAAKSKRWVTPNFTLQAKQRRNQTGVNIAGVETGCFGSARIGFTATKKTGNSVRRNRIRRRLKSAIDKIASGIVKNNIIKPDYDYVLIARELILLTDFVILTNELISAFEGVHKPRSSAKANRDTLTL